MARVYGVLLVAKIENQNRNSASVNIGKLKNILEFFRLSLIRHSFNRIMAWEMEFFSVVLYGLYPCWVGSSIFVQSNRVYEHLNQENAEEYEQLEINSKFEKSKGRLMKRETQKRQYQPWRPTYYFPNTFHRTGLIFYDLRNYFNTVTKNLKKCIFVMELTFRRLGSSTSISNMN